MDIFSVPVGGKFLIYSPLHHLTALVNPQALYALRAALMGQATPSTAVLPLVERLQAPGDLIPEARKGALDDPMFLGIIPTRGCNLGCRYCDFAAPKHTSPMMEVTLAREAVDAYFRLLCGTGKTKAEVHFFGGEPFYAEKVVHFVVEYARMRATQLGMRVRFEATSNGLYSTARCEWIADHFDTLVLSLDGLPDIQERHRPSINGHKTAEIIVRNAKILSEGTVELVLRACITSDTVQRMSEIAHWFGREFRPSTVCFETLTASPLSEAAGFSPPDPYEFARQFDTAAQILAGYGIETVISSADLRSNRAGFCPVGKDALIVSPDGAVDACYLIEKDWNGLDMRLGRLDDGGFLVSPVALARVRNLTVHTKPLCADCLCRFHCAGGCHVNHKTDRPAGHFDDLCVQTRIITIAALLRQMGQQRLADTWLADQAAVDAMVWQRSDRLVDEVTEHDDESDHFNDPQPYSLGERLSPYAGR